MTFDAATGKCLDLKLCDFGLSTVFALDEILTDFCGSPGFFAPEMLLDGKYNGDKADIWSIGCILLEMMLGHQLFTDTWMSVYDNDILQNKEVFKAGIASASISALRYLEDFPDLHYFVAKTLETQSSKRPDIKGLAALSWLKQGLDAEIKGLEDESKLAKESNSFANKSSSASEGSNFAADHFWTEVILPEKQIRRQIQIDNKNINGPLNFPHTPSIADIKTILQGTKNPQFFDQSNPLEPSPPPRKIDFEQCRGLKQTPPPPAPHQSS